MSDAPLPDQPMVTSRIGSVGRFELSGAAGQAQLRDTAKRPHDGAPELCGLGQAAMERDLTARAKGQEHEQSPQDVDRSAKRARHGAIDLCARETVETEPTRAPIQMERVGEATRVSTVAGSASAEARSYIYCDFPVVAPPKLERSESDCSWIDLNDSSDSDSDVDDVEALVTPSLGHQPVFHVQEHPQRLMSSFAPSPATGTYVPSQVKPVPSAYPICLLCKQAEQVQVLSGPKLNPASTAYHLLQAEEYVTGKVEALLEDGTIQTPDVDQSTLRLMLIRLVKVCTDHNEPIAFAETAVGTLAAFSKSRQLAAFAHEQHAAPATILEGMCGLALLLAVTDAPDTDTLQQLMQSAHQLMGDVPQVEYHVRRCLLAGSQEHGGHFVLRTSNLLRTLLAEGSGLSVNEVKQRNVLQLADEVWLVGTFMELGMLTTRGIGDGPFAAALWVCRCALEDDPACEAAVWPKNLSWLSGRSYDQAQELTWSYVLEARDAAAELPASADREKRQFLQVVDRVENTLRAMGQWDWE